MFGKLFGKKKEVVDDEVATKAAILDAAIEEARATNSVAHLKIGAEELVQRLLGSGPIKMIPKAGLV